MGPRLPRRVSTFGDNSGTISRCASHGLDSQRDTFVCVRCGAGGDAFDMSCVQSTGRHCAYSPNGSRSSFEVRTPLQPPKSVLRGVFCSSKWYLVTSRRLVCRPGSVPLFGGDRSNERGLNLHHWSAYSTRTAIFGDHLLSDSRDV